MDYYIASEQGPLGPYSIDQLKERRLKAEDMVWCQGMPEWCRADQIPDLQEIIRSIATPPLFNRQHFESQNALHQQTDNIPTPEQKFYHYNDMTCPPTYRWLAIIAFLGIIPCAIVALIKSVMVTRLWEEGKYDAAHIQSKKALMWGAIGAIAGIPLSIYMLFFNDDALSQNILNQLL